MRRKMLSSAASLSVLFAALLLPAGVAASSRVELVNNGYENLVVGISPSLPESEGATLIPIIKDAIKKASEVLFTATRSRAFFRDVRIVIPKSWSNTDTDEVAVFESFKESELRIDNPNPVYENQPYTRQPGECGDPGEFIHMTPAYLKEQVYSYYYGPPAKVLVMEWARLRWGVYDEIGYSGDPKYPIFFSLPREVADGRTDVQNQVVYQVNVCTDTYLNGKERMWFDESMRCTYTHEGLPDGDCVFFPDANQTATSSLMSFPLVFSDTLVEFCDDHTHNSLAKTKQNDRCDGQSVWEVMLQHSDFKGNANPAISQAEEPNIKVVRETDADYVLVLDYSGSMSTADRMVKLQLAAQRWLLHEVPLYSSVAIVRFDSTASLLAPLTKIVGETERKSLANQIHTNNNGGTSIGAGLKMAVELLEGRSDKNVFLITDGEENEAPMIADVMDEIISKKLCVSTLALGGNAAKDLEKLGDLTKCPSFTVNDNDVSNALENAFEGVSTRQQSVSLEESFIKIEETPKIQTPTPEYEGSFFVDSTVGMNLTFRLKTDAKSHVLSGPSLIKPDGTTLKGAADFDDIGNVWTIVVPEAEEGAWHWKVTLSQDSSKYIQATVLALPRDPNDAPIVTTVKFLAPATGVSPKDQNIKIMATVMKGNSPIRGADVVAYVTPPDISVSAQEYELLDNGVGADAVSGDGIYSRYMTKFAGEGRYSIKALLCGKKLSNNHLCLLCSGCNQHIPSARLHYHRQQCIRAGAGKGSKGSKIATHRSSHTTPGNLQQDLPIQQVSTRPLSPLPGPSRSITPQPGPSRILSPQPGPSRSITAQPEISRARVNRKYYESDSDVISDKEEEEDNIVETPHIISRGELFQGAAVRLGFSIPNQDQPSPSDYLRRNQDYFTDVLQIHRSTLGCPPPSTKSFTGFNITLSKIDFTTGNVMHIEKDITLCSYAISSEDECRRAVCGWAEEAEAKLEEWLSDEGSGLDLESINAHDITISHLLVPQAIGRHVAYPEDVRGGHYIFNPTGNTDCVIRSLAAGKWLAAGRSKNNLHRAVNTPAKCARLIKHDAEKLPTSWETLGELERDNSLSIYVYTLEKTNIFHEKYAILQVRKGREDIKERLRLHLLLLKNEHACLITDFNKYMDVFTMRGRNVHKHFCRTCFSSFPDQRSAESHMLECEMPTKITYPVQGSKLAFVNYGKAFAPSHMCIYDFEAFMDKTGGGERCIAQHKACAYSYIIIDRQGEVVDSFLYQGADAATHFVENLSNKWADIVKNMPYHPLHMSNEDEEAFKKAEMCEMCNQKFPTHQQKHRHHDHTKDRMNYIGAYCARCNLQMKNHRTAIPCLAHNHSYDLGLILKEMQVNTKIKILTKQGLRYHSVELNNLKFLDSLAFMNASLSSLAKTHIESSRSLRYSKHILRHLPDEAQSLLLTGKGIFPYEYLDDLKKLEETSLPPIEKFYSSLTGETVTEEEYAHALKVWNAAGCRTLGDYLECYLRTDVGLLADVITEWRSMLAEKYDLDIVNYVSLPGYAYDAFLKMTKTNLELISDPELARKIEQSVRGGLTTCVRPLTVAKNSLVNPHHDPQKESSTYILYLDFNSLYATVMSEKLPYGNIRKLPPREKSEFIASGLTNHDESGDVGHWVVADLRVPPEVARKTDDLPLLIHHMNIRNQDISPYNKQLLASQNRRLPRKNQKLVASHLPQKDHLILLKHLQLLIDLGVEVERVSDVYEFSQREFLSPFIHENIKARREATDKAQQLCFKTLSNSVFGRCLMNPLKRLERASMVCNASSFLKKIRSPFFKRFIPLAPNRVITISRAKTVSMAYPQYVGFTILELAKLKLYNFYYKVLKTHYGDRVQLCYSDTDSYILSVETDDIYKELSLSPLKEWIDTSNFSHDHPLYNQSVKGKLGLLKSETGEIPIKEAICLKPKTYSLLLNSDQTSAGAKGICRAEKRRLKHDNFRRILHEKEVHFFKQVSITNVGGQMMTTQMKKRGLSLYDDKRWYVNAYKSLAYGHPDIKHLSEAAESEEGEEETRGEFVRDVATGASESEKEEGEGEEEEGEEEAETVVTTTITTTGEERLSHLWRKREYLRRLHFPSVVHNNYNNNIRRQRSGNPRPRKRRKTQTGNPFIEEAEENSDDDFI